MDCILQRLFFFIAITVSRMSMHVSKAVVNHQYFEIRPMDDKIGDGLLLRPTNIAKMIFVIINILR